MDFNNNDNRRGGQSVQDMIGIGSDFGKSVRGDGAPMQGGPGMNGMPMQGGPGMNRMPMQGGPGMNRMPMQGGSGMNGMPMQGGPGMNRMPMQGGPGMNGMPMQGGSGMNGMPIQGGPGMNGMPMQGGPGMNRMPMQGNGMPPMGRNDAGDHSERLARALENSLNNGGSTGRLKSRNPLPPENEGNVPRRVFGREEDGNRVPPRRYANGKAEEGFSLNPPTDMMGIIAKFATPIFIGILAVCLVITLVAYAMSDKTKTTSKKNDNKTMDLTAVTGIIPQIYENKNQLGGSGTGSSMENTSNIGEDGLPAAPTAMGEEQSLAGTITSSSSSSSSTSGATMIIDSGAGVAGYNQAASFDELITQLENGLASGDTDFIGTKLAYENENGELCGYPQSVVDYFVSYMSVNADKRTAFIQEINSDKYSTQNGSAYVIKLPQIKFVVNMGYDNTTIALSGFSNQVVNAGQSAEITPLLPCMYTLTISNPDWTEDVTRDIEANVNETTLSINIKP